MQSSSSQPSATEDRARTPLRIAVSRVLLALTLLLAFVLPPLLIGGANAARASLSMRSGPPAPLDTPLPERPAHDPSKLTAVVVAGNVATESSDLMGPYETLVTSGRFNVYVAAPERILSPLFPGDLSIVPHYSFAEYDAAFGGKVDLVVVPYIPQADAEDAAVARWIRAKADSGSTLLSICAGALAVAESGAIDGRSSTTHHFSISLGERQYPAVHWVRGQRYVDDGQFISSAGVTSGVDATLHTLDRMFGRATALHTAQAIGYPHTRFLDDTALTIRLRDDTGVWPSFYTVDRAEIGLLFYDGVRELEIASVIDAYPRTMAAAIRTLAAERTIVRSQHGLDLVPRADLSTAPALDRLLVPGSGPVGDDAAAVQAWAAQQNGLAVEMIHAAGGYPYDATLRDIARAHGAGVAAAVANTLEYPTRDLVLDGPAVRLDLLVRPLVLGLLGLAAALWLRRRLASRASALSPRLRPRLLAGGRFVLHFGEMSLAMLLGMVVFHLLAGGRPGQGGTASGSAAFLVAWELGMMVFMTVPMVAWMRVRGHSWQDGLEMSVGMLAPVIAIDLLLVAGLGGPWPWLQHLSGPAMLLGMLAVMLARLDRYAGHAHHTHGNAEVRPLANA
ncbi:MAG: DJ-1/PfpI family protein [Chloroflexi bacterium]|nr:DJ-1/PfpI family protein [Chloroflexota bacterium]